MRNWDLLREMSQVQRDMDAVLRGFGLGPLRVAGNGAQPLWPRINVRENTENFLVEALLPGIDAEQLEMSIIGNTLSIDAERHVSEETSDGYQWLRREYEPCSFRRVIELPAEVDSDQVKAEYRDGLLRVTLPKATATKPRKIAITTH